MPKNRTEQAPFEIQAETSQYYSSNYLSPERLSSFGYQIELSLGLDGYSYAEVGIGAGFLGTVLTRNNKKYIGIDNHSGLSPDLISVLPYLPIETNSIDVCMCFQVLEHLPKSMLQSCISELARISRVGVVLSIPNATKTNKSIKQNLAIQIYKIFKFPQRFAPITYPQDEQHFWEIGRGLEIQELINCTAKENLKLKISFRNKFNLYHHFFVFIK